jgi:hypothetical protein
VSSLLENTRRIGKLIQNSPGYPGRFEEIARTLAEVLESQVFVVAKNGKILGHSLAHLADDDFEGADSGLLYNGYMPPRTNEELLKVFETDVNRRPDDGLSMLCDETLGGSDWCRLTITPIIGGGERVGTLILSKIDGELGDSDIILTEYGESTPLLSWPHGGFSCSGHKVQCSHSTRNQLLRTDATKSFKACLAEATFHILLSIFLALCGGSGSRPKLTFIGWNSPLHGVDT